MGTITRAAEHLKVDCATVSRRLKALERDLGTPCFDRSSGRLELNDQGHRIARIAETMERAAAAIEHTVRPNQADIAGHIRIATTRTMARALVYPAAEQLAIQHAEISIEVDTQVQRIDMIRGDADLALTPYPAQHPRLLQRLVFSATFGLFGSEAYFAEHGVPKAGDLRGHRLLGLAEVAAKRTAAGHWWNENIHGGTVVLRSSSVEELLHLCEEGRGLAPVFLFRAEERGLIRVPAIAAGELPHWFVIHPDIQQLPRTRAVIKKLRQLTAAPGWLRPSSRTAPCCSPS